MDNSARMPYYDETARNYNELHGEEQKRKARLIIQHREMKEEESLLDVGCGTCIATELFPCRTTGIDPSEKLLEQCRIDTVKGKTESLPFRDESFDIVVSLTAVHNFDNVRKGLEEMRRVARSDIIFFLRKQGLR